jgi:PKD repeat protein
MKKYFVALSFFCLGLLLCGGEITITSPGQIFVGSDVQFRFEPDQAPGANYLWNFGDGLSDTTNNNQSHHIFKEPGNFQVTCQYLGSPSIPANGELMVNVGDNRRISPQGNNFRSGKRVVFQADNFLDNNLRWDFGDGTIENGPKNNGHIYQNPGNFTVRAFDSGGSSPTAITCQLMIEADNRQLNAAPNAPRVFQNVDFSAQNFPGASLKWDFGDGTVENGGPAMNHFFRQAGNFQVRVWENSEPPDAAIKLQISVAPDNRQLQVAPQPARANMAVNFTAGNFASADLKWNYGDGKIENGGPARTHVYSNPGNFQVLVWEAGEAADSALKTSVAVQPDIRQVNISSPPELFQGSEISFEGRNFSSPSLKWDFGDGTVERGGARQAHSYQRSGNFVVKIVEADAPDSLPLEKKIQVLNDNRGLAVKTGMIFANSEFEIEALNFRGSVVSWDFGDGPVSTGPRLMKHRYNRSGQFRIRAIDFAGRDGKFIETNVLVENDSRLVSLPGEIIAGEAIDMQLKNAAAGNFIWKFSDGETRSGPELKGKAFRTAGPQKITIADAAGKYPPLEKMIQVLPDMRALKSSAGFTLPKEEVAFTAMNFKGPGIRWDFGDGAVKENGQAMEKHVYNALGRFQVKAVDFNGRSSKVFSAEVVVAEMTPGFEIDTLEFVFDNGKYYRVIAKNSPGPGYQLRVKAKGRGVLSGQFMLDNMPIGLFQLLVNENQSTPLTKNQMAALPVLDLGLHELTVKFSNYAFNKKIPIIKYFVSQAGMIQIVAPVMDSKVSVNNEIKLSWAIERKKPLFEIAISEIPFQFMDDKQIVWRPVASGSSFTFIPGSFKPGIWIYWQVRLLNENKQVQTTSEIAAFKLSE